MPVTQRLALRNMWFFLIQSSTFRCLLSREIQQIFPPFDNIAVSFFSADLGTCRDWRKRNHRNLKRRSVALRFQLLSSKETRSKSFARNLLLCAIESTCATWFLTNENISYQALSLSSYRANVFILSASEESDGLRNPPEIAVDSQRQR